MRKHLCILRVSLLFIVFITTVSTNLLPGEETTYSKLKTSFNISRPGFGVDPGIDHFIDIPMAYALIAKAAAIHGDKELAINAANWLVNNSGSEGITGWGQNRRWDAFSDGTINPANTIYGITTAIAADSLLDVYCLTGSEKYLDKSLQSLNYYLDYRTITPSGIYFWYSDKQEDAINVYNVNAMLAGVYGKAGYIANIDRFTDAAELAALNVVANKNNDTTLSWPYYDQSFIGKTGHNKPNDLVHAAHIVYGLLKFQHFTGIKVINNEPMENYLRSFISDSGKAMDFRSSDILSKDHLRRASSSGLGILVATLVKLEELHIASNLINTYQDYEFDDLRYDYHFGDRLNSTRGRAFLFFGAAAFETGSTEKSGCNKSIISSN